MTLPAEIHRDSIRGALEQCGVPGSRIFLLDEFYALLCDKDIAKLESYVRRQFRRYRGDSFDCDDFVKQVWAAASLANATTQERRRDMQSGVALGFITVPARQHVLAWTAHLAEDKRVKIVWRESQPVLGNDMRTLALRPVILENHEIELAGVCVA